jgi:hypothetical protein
MLFMLLRLDTRNCAALSYGLHNALRQRAEWCWQFGSELLQLSAVHLLWQTLAQQHHVP